MRSGVAGQGHEYHVLFAALCDLTTAEDSARISKKNDLQKDCWVDSGGACGIVSVSGVEHAEVDIMINQIIYRVFDRPRLDLSRERNRQKPGLVLEILSVASHSCIPLPNNDTVFYSKRPAADTFSTASLHPWKRAS
jgi:hypothetical protein